MPTVYSYSRVSTPRQLAGFGLERQAIDETRKWCEANGLTLDESNILHELGRSAFHGDNTQPTTTLGQFLTAVEAGRIERGDYLVIEHLNRLTRENIRRALGLLLLLIDHGINVVTSHDKRIYSDKSETLEIDLIVAIVFLMDAHKSSAEKQRVALNNWEKKRRAARDGGLLTSMIPTWCSIDEKGKIVPNDKAKIVGHIFTDVARGMGCWTIAKRLNDEHIPPLNGGKQKRHPDTHEALGPISELWSVSAVAKLIQNDAVLGWYQPHRVVDKKRVPHGEPILYYPRVIEQNLADRARAQIASRRVTGGTAGAGRPLGGRKGVYISNLFTGIAKCGVCGSSMFLYNFNPKRGTAGWLRCTNAIRSDTDSKCSNRAGIPYAKFERWVVGLIGGFAIPKGEAGGVGRMVQDLLERLAEAKAIAEKTYEALKSWDAVEKAPLVQRRISELDAEYAKLTVTITDLEKQIEIEKGKATPSDEIAAVQRLLKDVEATDKEARLLARARVAAGLRGFIRHFLCFPNRSVIGEYDLGNRDSVMCVIRAWLTPVGEYEVYHTDWDWGQRQGKPWLTFIDHRLHRTDTNEPIDWQQYSAPYPQMPEAPGKRGRPATGAMSAAERQRKSRCRT
jgi:DNA invertase Pin-like site-specific DNA recombinase